MGAPPPGLGHGLLSGRPFRARGIPANPVGPAGKVLSPVVDPEPLLAPPNEFETFFQSFSGADYQITAVVPYQHRGSPRPSRQLAELQRSIALVENRFPAGQSVPVDDLRAQRAELNSLRQALRDLQRREVEPQNFYKTFGQIQTLSITSRRSVEPVRRLGETSPAAYTKGPRTFAGSMVFILLKEDPLLDLYRVSLDDRYDGEPYYVQDRMPPFNILITGVNEYGHVVEAALFGVTLIADGITLSIDDLYTEIQYTYVARHRTPFVRKTVGKTILDSVGSQTVPLGRGAISELDPYDPFEFRKHARTERTARRRRIQNSRRQ